ncbi:RNA polymerase sigma factor [Labilithrix luteola]|uniref:RNA polymerase sigma factor n=1 Tax=Labilithrix luteola TaxID=1391654 RepID=UPI001F0AF410|nr:sigma-70 family RNA polymerase sigma factor [Labilithrix luteola]
MVAARAHYPTHPTEPEVTTDARDAHGRLRRLFEQEYDFVWRSLRRLGVPPENTEDAAQQVFVIVSRKLDRIELEDERRYLFGVVVRVASNARRSRGRRREVSEDQAGEPLDEAATADGLLEKKDARALLDRVLGAITEDLRVVFVLFELEEMTLVEISAVLGIPLGTATSRLRRAREQFRTVAARLRRSGGSDV